MEKIKKIPIKKLDATLPIRAAKSSVGGLRYDVNHNKDAVGRFMVALKQSIARTRIEMPLEVMKLANGKYLVIDGFRRYRVALDLGLKEVLVRYEE